MRVFLLILLIIPTSSCVWLPVSGGPNHPLEKQWFEEQTGLSFGDGIENAKRYAGVPDWQLTEENAKHFLYSSRRNFGFGMIGLSGPYGGGGFVASGYTGNQTICYRLSFSKEGKLYDASRKVANTDAFE